MTLTKSRKIYRNLARNNFSLPLARPLSGGAYVVSAPSITVQPQDITVQHSSIASFSVSAIGSYPMTYQWQYYNGTTWVNISGATSNSYSVQVFYPTQNGRRYRVILTNDLGSATSSEARSYVNAPNAVASLAQFIVTGVNAGLDYAPSITPATAHFLVTGKSAYIDEIPYVVASTAQFLVTGNQAIVDTSVSSLQAQTAEFVVTGRQVSFEPPLEGLTAETANFVVTGNNSNIEEIPTIQAQTAQFVVTGKQTQVGSGIGSMVIGSTFIVGEDVGIGSMIISSTFIVG